MNLHQRFDGRFYIIKLPTVFSAAPHRPNCLDLIFSLKRTHFEIKIFHLPPAIGNENTTKQHKSSCQRVQEEF